MPDAARKVVVDSGPIIGLFDADDAYHRHAVDFIRRSHAQLISTMAVITEAMHVLESLPARMDLLAWIQAGAVSFAEPAGADFARISELIEKYADLPMDFTDAVVVALCERLDIHHVATVDRDFDIYRTKRRTKLVNVLFA